MFSQKVSDILVAPLILVLFYTGIMKITDTALFASQLRSAPWHLLVVNSEWFSYFLPIAELLTVVALIVPRLRIYGFLASIILFVGFTTYLAYFILKGVQLPCSCGGIIAQLNWQQHLLLNSILLLVSAWGVLNERKKINSNHSSQAPSLSM